MPSNQIHTEKYGSNENGIKNLIAKNITNDSIQNLQIDPFTMLKSQCSKKFDLNCNMKRNEMSHLIRKCITNPKTHFEYKGLYTEECNDLKSVYCFIFSLVDSTVCTGTLSFQHSFDISRFKSLDSSLSSTTKKINDKTTATSTPKSKVTPTIKKLIGFNTTRNILNNELSYLPDELVESVKILFITKKIN